MTVTQVYNILNNVVEQMKGEVDINIVDNTGIVALGNYVISSDNTKDDFLNTFVDRIGRTIIDERPYNPDIKSLLNNSFEFGAVMQKIYVEPMPAEQAKHWGLENNTGVDQYIITKPVAHQALFSNMDTWQVNVTIPDMQLRSAFTNAETMAAFIDAVFMSMRTSMQIQLEALANTCYTNFIAERLVYKQNNPNSITVINLLTDYNTHAGTTLTAEQALDNTEFLKYATKQINMTIKRMERASILFNQMGYTRHTPREYMRVTMLADFTESAYMYLQADTYHKELVSLPYYNEVPYWQGTGTGYDFKSVSTISVLTASGSMIKQDGVIGLICDIESMGIMHDNRRMRSSYNSNGEYTNYFDKADMGYYNDLSENGIVFVVSDSLKPLLPFQTANSVEVGTMDSSKGVTISSVGNKPQVIGNVGDIMEFTSGERALMTMKVGATKKFTAIVPNTTPEALENISLISFVEGSAPKSTTQNFPATGSGDDKFYIDNADSVDINNLQYGCAPGTSMSVNLTNGYTIGSDSNGTYIAVLQAWVTGVSSSTQSTTWFFI